LLLLHVKPRPVATRPRNHARIPYFAVPATAAAAAAARQVGEHVAAIDAVLTELAPHVAQLFDGGASALAELEAALACLFWAVDRCRGLGALGAVWHARQLEEDFQGAQQARSWLAFAGDGDSSAGAQAASNNSPAPPSLRRAVSNSLCSPESPFSAGAAAGAEHAAAAGGAAAGGAGRPGVGGARLAGGGALRGR